jgi:hypothetical protein
VYVPVSTCGTAAVPLICTLLATGAALHCADTITVGCDAFGFLFKVKSFPVPRKLFDCFTAVFHGEVPAVVGAVAEKVNVMLPCGGTRSADVPLASWMMLDPDDRVAVQFRGVDGFANVNGLALQVTFVHPVGIVICAEPNPWPPIGILLVSVMASAGLDDPVFRHVGEMVGV